MSKFLKMFLTKETKTMMDSCLANSLKGTQHLKKKKMKMVPAPAPALI